MENSSSLSGNVTSGSFLLTPADVAGIVVGWVLLACLALIWLLVCCRRWRLEKRRFEQMHDPRNDSSDLALGLIGTPVKVYIPERAQSIGGE